jgi:arginyl-tRNA synthetase
MYKKAYATVKRALQQATELEEVPLIDGGDHADLASTIAFQLAKSQKKSPVAIAGELKARIAETLSASGIEVEVQGPYLNFHFGPEFVRSAMENALAPDYGSLPTKEERFCIEHTSANPNGPLHVGHIRNSVIGDTLARVFRKAGYPLEVEYYLNDMGRQIAIVSWGFDTLGLEKKPEEKDDHFVARVYIAANKELRENESLNKEIDRRMGLIEAGDPEMVKAFREVVSLCAEGIKETLERLYIDHDLYVWESDFVRNGMMEESLDRITRLPQAKQDDILSLDLSEFGFEKEYVLRRSDGTSVYASRDIAYHIWKGRRYDRIIDVLGADHKLIGAQLSCTLHLLNERQPEIVYFEFVSLPEGSMSTRQGKFVSADELINEVTKQAFEEVTKRRPELDVETRWEIANSVAIGAIRYDIVRVSQEKSTVFDWKEALDFERQSAPYIQYAHARACSILEKAGGFEESFTFTSGHEIALAKHIARFPIVIEKIVDELRPHLLALYARELADLFNTFYRYEPVLKSEGDTRNSRLTLVRAAQNTLNIALNTLGIDALRSM